MACRFEHFVPMDRRHALHEGRSLALHPHGASLVADLSGFTPMTEALREAYGPRRGAERLADELDRVYKGLIDAVHRHGGSVMDSRATACTAGSATRSCGPRGSS